MAHAIKLKYGSPAGWSYIDLTDANHGNVSYVPGTPAEGAEEIVESGTWRVAGSSVSDLIAKIGAIEDVFRMAAAYDLDQVGTYEVWLTKQLDGESAAWESRVFEGKLDLTEDVFGVDWANRSTEVVLYWRREGWWEKFTAIQSSNDNQAIDDYSFFYNWNDKTGLAPNKKENYIDILGANVPGDLPAPLLLSIVGPGAASSTFNDLLILHNAKTIPSTFVYWTEGETGTDTTDANRSGGKYHNYVLAAGTPSNILTDFSATAVDGAWIRCLLSAKFTGTIKARPVLEINGQLYYGPYSIITNAGTAFTLYDLGMIHFPNLRIAPGLFVTSKCGVQLYSAGGLTVSVDYILTSPIDSFGRVQFDTAFNGVDTILAVNFRFGFCYETSVSLNKVKSTGTIFGNVYLEPNKDQRLIFKFTNGNVDTLSAADYYSVYVYAYLRKRTL